MVSWDPGSYAQFATERARPFHDLLARVQAREPRQVVDLGCGPGDLTAGLARRWRQARVLGVDTSPAMLERAGEQAASPDLDGRLTFVEADLATWSAHEPVDVVVSNAALQWVPSHLELLGAWVQSLAPGGWLALQVPGNFGAPSHELLRELAADARFADRLDGALRGAESVGQPTTYAALFAEAGCAVDAWETTYVQVLDPQGVHGDDAVLAWMRGTGLRPVTDALADDPPLCEEFVHEYGTRLRKAYPRRSWGTLLPFRRVFAVAQVGGA